MEAPAKSGGTRKQRNRRDLIGRLSTLPPIAFLKKHNPLRRKRRPKLGFDQPPHEIKELALPLRQAPAGLSTRVWRRLQAVMSSPAALVRRQAAALAGRGAAVARAGWGRIRGGLSRAGSVASRAVARLAGSRAGRWCARRAYAVGSSLEALRPAPWQAGQSTWLMARTQRVGRVTVGLVACEWTAMIGLVALLGVHAFRGHAWDTGTVNICGLAVCMLSLTGLVLHTWHQHLLASWKELELFICGSCGELRNFSPSLPCSRCGTHDMPVCPGRVPDRWSHWRHACSALATGAPAGTVGMILLTGRLVFPLVPGVVAGSLLLVVSLGLAAAAVLVAAGSHRPVAHA
jgi:hypothetical protein